ncbi:MAG: hypothetical protein MZV64_26960 [Ignavibacteriales bacterium]|nr:hypothetical protein [Ignavibacteriales bacterium]
MAITFDGRGNGINENTGKTWTRINKNEIQNEKGTIFELTKLPEGKASFKNTSNGFLWEANRTQNENGGATYSNIRRPA